MAELLRALWELPIKTCNMASRYRVTGSFFIIALPLHRPAPAYRCGTERNRTGQAYLTRSIRAPAIIATLIVEFENRSDDDGSSHRSV